MTVHYTGYQSSRNLCTEQSPKDTDDTRCCTDTIVLLKVTSPPVTSVLNSHLKTLTIPDAVLIQFFLLKVTSPPVTSVLNSHLKTVTIPDAVLIQLSS